MGNYVSCTLLVQGGNKQSRSTKVIFPNGEIRNVHQQVKAAEVMLEIPNFFIVNSRSLHIGKRFSALNADEDLEIANVYVMFPMKRLNSFVSAADLGALFLTANSVSKKVSFGRVKILPEYTEEPKFDDKIDLPKLKLDDIEEFSTPEFKKILSMCRSKKPLLETIVEEPSR